MEYTDRKETEFLLCLTQMKITGRENCWLEKLQYANRTNVLMTINSVQVTKTHLLTHI